MLGALWLAASGLFEGQVRAASWIDGWRATNSVWRGVHVITRLGKSVKELESAVPALAGTGMNVLIVEIDYNFAFVSHPELRDDTFLTREEAAHLTEVCHQHGVRLIPQFNCLGHQSWAKDTFPLLRVHPEFDETPGKYPNNDGIYCRSWCPLHPGVNAVAFDLMDELADAFQADAIHIGMDEVFLIGSPDCPRCRGKNPADLFARSVNDLHQHVVKDRHLEMLMWADRLLDGKAMGLGEWEAATNHTEGAISQIPKDIVLCDWHYETLDKYQGHPTSYVSIPYLAKAGFRVWPTGWKNVAAVNALNREAITYRGTGVIGYLCSTWGAAKIPKLAEWPPLLAGFEPWK